VDGEGDGGGACELADAGTEPDDFGEVHAGA